MRANRKSMNHFIARKLSAHYKKTNVMSVEVNPPGLGAVSNFIGFFSYIS